MPTPTRISSGRTGPNTRVGVSITASSSGSDSSAGTTLS